MSENICWVRLIDGTEHQGVFSIQEIGNEAVLVGQSSFLGEVIIPLSSVLEAKFCD